MTLPRFDYLRADSVEDAITILEDNPSARLLAGGTDLLANLKNGLGEPSHLIRIEPGSGLEDIRWDQKKGLCLGAFTSLAELAASWLVRRCAPGLAYAAGRVAAHQLRVMGTLGGNILQDSRCVWYNQSAWWRSGQATCIKAGGGVCHAVPKDKACYACYHGDLAPVLIVLGAEAQIQGPEGIRTEKVGKLFSGDGVRPNTLERFEILTRIRIPSAGLTRTTVYIREAERSAIDFPIVGLAVSALPMAKTWRVCFTAVDRRPVRSVRAEKFFSAKGGTAGISPDDLPKLEPKPVNNTRTGPAEKRRLMRSLLIRAADVVGREGGP